MLNKIVPKAGRLLISEPFMADPNFKRSVVLLTEHNEEGSVGYILNQPSNLVLKDIMADLYEADNRVYFGGPVASDTLHFIHRCFDQLQSGDDIGNGIYWGGNFETLKILINNNSISDKDIKFFIGYSGWDALQLSKELKQNTWMVSDISHPDIIFTGDEEQLWRDVIVDLGPKYAHITNFPTDPSLN